MSERGQLGFLELFINLDLLGAVQEQFIIIDLEEIVKKDPVKLLRVSLGH